MRMSMSRHITLPCAKVNTKFRAPPMLKIRRGEILYMRMLNKAKSCVSTNLSASNCGWLA
jgi:hypothetical protein